VTRAKEIENNKSEDFSFKSQKNIKKISKNNCCVWDLLDQFGHRKEGMCVKAFPPR
jgi:hypothetical protein